MSPLACPLACSLPSTTMTQVIKRILSSGRITNKDRKWFLVANFSGSPLSVKEENGVREIFDRLKKGWLRVVD
ncbi:MAG: hypothetical protein AB4038_08765 [Prochloraceae cyanobacterium]